MNKKVNKFCCIKVLRFNFSINMNKCKIKNFFKNQMVLNNTKNIIYLIMILIKFFNKKLIILIKYFI